MTVSHRTWKTRLMAGVLTSAFVLSAAALPISLAGISLVPAAQAQSFDISFDSFHGELARYGDWVYSDLWGTVWVPDVPRDFHPYYTDGRWERTREYGWTWVSDYEWGDIAFHYGRWVNDIDDGWIWVPGYVWSPGWVVWRGDSRYMGWMPMPPDDDFLRGDENVSFRFSFGGSVVDFNNYNDGYYGYANWYGRDYDEARFARNWVFIGASHIGDRDYRANTVRQPQVVNIIHQTRNVTNYTVVNNYIVNRSADGPATRSRVRGSQPAARPAAEVLRRPNSVRTVDAGRQVERRAVQETPHGRGTANSAPKPQAAETAKLSDRAQPRGGRGSGRLYTHESINNAPGNALPATRIPAAAGAPPVQLTPPGTPQPPVGGNRGDRANQDRANQDRANQDRANQDRANQDRANQDQQNQARDRQVQEKQAQEKQAQEKQALDKQVQEKQARDKQAQDQRANEQRANEQRAQQEQQRAQQQKAAQERAQQQRAQPQSSAPDQGAAVRAPERPDRTPPAAQAPAAAQAPGTDSRANGNRGNDNGARGRRNQADDKKDDDKKDDKKDQN